MAVDLLGVRRVYALVFMTQQIDILAVDSIRIVPYQSVRIATKEERPT